MRRVTSMLLLVVFFAAGCTASGGEIASTSTMSPSSTSPPAASTAGPTSTSQPSPSLTPTSTTARSGMGRLAFIKKGDLWVMGVPDGKPQRLTELGDVHTPRWSPSGEWLAFLRDKELWLITKNGEMLHPLIEDRIEVNSFAWSPVDDLIAYVTQERSLQVKHPLSSVTTLIPADDMPVPGVEVAGEFAWRPDGGEIAFAVEAGDGPARDYVGLWTVLPVKYADPKEQLGQEAPQHGLLLADWANSGKALLYWRVPAFSASLMMDGAPLYSLSLAGDNAPRKLADAVLNYADFVQPGPPGSARLALVAGGGREVWRNKKLMVFEEGAGENLPPPNRVVSSPSWSPDGNLIAVSAKPDVENPVEDNVWMMPSSPNLFVVDVNTEESQQLTAQEDVWDGDPLWSKNGQHLLFGRMEEEDAISLWTISIDRREAQKLVEDLSVSSGLIKASTRGGGPDAYGHVDFHRVFDWWQEPERPQAAESEATKTITSRWGISYDIPAGWQEEEPGQYEGEDGYVGLAEFSGPGLTVDQACEWEANAHRDLHGEAPALHLQNQEMEWSSCWIWPSLNAVTPQAAVLLDNPGKGQGSSFLLLTMDPDHFSLITRSLRYSQKPTPQPTLSDPYSRLDNPPDPDELPDDLPMHSVHIGALTVEEYRIVEASVDEPGGREFLSRIPASVTEKRQAWREEEGSEHWRFLEKQGNIIGEITVGGTKLLLRETGERLQPPPGMSGYGFFRMDVEVIKDDQPIYHYSMIPHAAASPIYNFGSWGDQWLLEINGMLIVDGEIKNEDWDYQEIFEFQHMQGRPFFFFVQDVKTHLYFDGEVLPVTYDRVYHGECCGYARFNPGGNDHMVWFYALKDGYWHYVELGIYN